MTSPTAHMTDLDLSPRLNEGEDAGRVFHDIGQKLKESREKRKLTVEQVSSGLKIRGMYIRAIEDGLFQSLPGSIYVGGYLKNYADYLGEDSELMLADFRGAGGRSGDNDGFMLPELTHGEMKPGRMSLLIAAIILFLLYGIWHVMERRSTENRIHEAQQASLPAGAAQSAKALEARIVLLAKNDVEITIMGMNGEVLHTQLMHSGDTYFVPNNALTLKTATPEFIEFFVDGENVAPTGPAVVTEAGIVLEPNKLLESSGLKDQARYAE